jgi:hypothetical protein
MLISCSECAKEISSEAKVCPQCGAANIQKSAGVGKALLVSGGVLALIAVIGAAITAAPSSGRGIIPDLLAQRSQCESDMKGLQSAGLRLADSDNIYADVDIDETAWAVIEHTNKVKVALTIFCAKMPDTGDYAVYIRGLHNGKQLAHIINGNYYDE